MEYDESGGSVGPGAEPPLQEDEIAGDCAIESVISIRAFALLLEVLGVFLVIFLFVRGNVRELGITLFHLIFT